MFLKSIKSDISQIVDIDIIWMRYAYILANYAECTGDVSVGSVLIYRGMLIGYGWNSSVSNNDPSAHAEINALRMGGKYLGNYRLLYTTLYVTLEPCVMCVGAMIHARIYRLVYGARNKKTMWQRLWINNFFNYSMVNHHVLVRSGVLETECSLQVTSFFQRKR